MKSLFSKYKWIRIIYGLLILVAGVIVISIALNQPSDISTWLSIVVAVTLFTYSAALILTGAFALREKFFDITFLYAIIFIAIGVVFLVNPTIIESILTILVASILCAAGLIEIIEGSMMLVFKRKLFYAIVAYIIAVVLGAAGVLAIIFRSEVTQVAYIVTGSVVIIIALWQIAYGVFSVARKDIGGEDNDKSKGRKHNKIVEADVIEPTVENPESNELTVIDNNTVEEAPQETPEEPKE